MLGKTPSSTLATVQYLAVLPPLAVAEAHMGGNRERTRVAANVTRLHLSHGKREGCRHGLQMGVRAVPQVANINHG